MKLGYGFSWYKYGPYSQDLVFDSYAVLGSDKDRYEQAAGTWNFSENSNQKFKNFKKILGDNLQSAEMLELVASVDFLLNTWYPNAGQSDIVNHFKNHKTQFFDGHPIQDADIKKAFDLCCRLRQH